MTASGPLVSVLREDGQILWKHQGGIADFRGQRAQNGIRLSRRGDTVRFGFKQWGKEAVSFSLKENALTLNPPANQTLRKPITETEGLKISNWENGDTPKLNGIPFLVLKQYELSRSLAIAPDGSAFLLGTDWHLRLFDRKGKALWPAVDMPGAA